MNVPLAIRIHASTTIRHVARNLFLSREAYLVRNTASALVTEMEHVRKHTGEGCDSNEKRGLAPFQRETNDGLREGHLVCPVSLVSLVRRTRRPNRPEEPDRPDPRHAPRNVGLQDLAPCLLRR